jgi:DDE superfamily endonuclease
MLTYSTLKDRPREFLAATGLPHEEFARLLPAFAMAYSVLYPPDQTCDGKVRQRQVGGGAKGALPQMADKLLFILVYQKTNPLQTMHGLSFALSQRQTNYWIHHLLPVLQRAFADLGLAPERDASRVATSPLLLEGAPHLAIDGTERRRQRPQDATKQKAHYSGKQKAHTDKNLLLVNENTGKVGYLGPTLPGRTHDKKAADEAPIVYPTNATLDKDTGFQGYEPKGQALSVGDQLLNHLFSSARVVVEHVIAGVKRCRIVKDVLRLTKDGMSDLVMEIACGLHNLRVSCRHPLPIFDVRSLVVLTR